MIFNHKSVELVVGIPSYNEADNIAFVVKQIDSGLQQYYPDKNALIINVDNNSPDGTKKVFLRTQTKTDKKYISTLPGVKGKGNNFYNLFQEIKKLRPRACLVVDADLQSIEPDWIKKMLQPILDGYDYILPLYSRNEYDGSITNTIVYPVLYGILGINLRQPIAGDFSFSPNLSAAWLQPDWQESTRQFGIDIFMTLGAIFNKFRIGQVGLGSKIHKPSAPKLGPMFSQVVDTLFYRILQNKDFWLKDLELLNPPLVSNGAAVSPQPLSVDYKSMKKIAQLGWQEFKDYYQKIYAPELYQKIQRVFANTDFQLARTIWTDVLFRSLQLYDQNQTDRSKLVESLKPLYFARVDTFIKQTLDWDYQQCEELLASQANYVFDQRRQLIKMLNH